MSSCRIFKSSLRTSERHHDSPVWHHRYEGKVVIGIIFPIGESLGSEESAVIRSRYDGGIVETGLAKGKAGEASRIFIDWIPIDPKEPYVYPCGRRPKIIVVHPKMVLSLEERHDEIPYIEVRREEGGLVLKRVKFNGPDSYQVLPFE